MNIEIPPTLWSVKQTAKMLNVSESTVRRCLIRNDLDGYRVGRRVLIPQESIADMLRSRPYRDKSNGANSRKKSTLLSKLRGRR